MNKDKLIAYDLGTGGIKASLFGADGMSYAEVFREYETYYPAPGWVEQAPEDWWLAAAEATKSLIARSGCDPASIAAVGLSGHSLVAVPLDAEGHRLMDRVPIWCDMRAEREAEAFFARTDYDEWYATTGNGDPPQTYTVMKLMWLRDNAPEIYTKTRKILGSKDYVNYRLTGRICTDPSYASGFGVFDLAAWDYADRFFEAAGISREIFPEILPSDAIIGTVTAEAAALTGLMEGTPVVCGAVDNTCMSLGSTGLMEGQVYASLGSSAWLAVTSREPVIDQATHPFVFAHVKKGLYTSAVSIFSAGNSFRWIRDTLYLENAHDPDIYDRMNAEAAAVPPGSHGVLFNPTLAGGSAQEPSPSLKGGFMGLTLGATRGDLTRAAMEGVALALRSTLDILGTQVPIEGPILLTGGCSKSPLWRRIFCDVFHHPVMCTNIDQNAASLGAAALAAVGAGLWPDYGMIPRIHVVREVLEPDEAAARQYEELLQIYRQWTDTLAKLS